MEAWSRANGLNAAGALKPRVPLGVIVTVMTRTRGSGGEEFHEHRCERLRLDVVILPLERLQLRAGDRRDQLLGGLEHEWSALASNHHQGGHADPGHLLN